MKKKRKKSLWGYMFWQDKVSSMEWCHRGNYRFISIPTVYKIKGGYYDKKVRITIEEV